MKCLILLAELYNTKLFTFGCYQQSLRYPNATRVGDASKHYFQNGNMQSKDNFKYYEISVQ